MCENTFLHSFSYFAHTDTSSKFYQELPNLLFYFYFFVTKDARKRVSLKQCVSTSLGQIGTITVRNDKDDPKAVSFSKRTLETSDEKVWGEREKEREAEWLCKVGKVAVWVGFLRVNKVSDIRLSENTGPVSLTSGLLSVSLSQCQLLSHVLLFPIMVCSLPGSSVPGILQIRILEWRVISFSRGFSQLRGQTQVSRIAGRQILYCLNHQRI